MVPEAHHFPALASEISVADFVAGVFRMLRSVGLDDQSRRDAEEVHNIGANWDLTAKLETAQAAVAEEAPEAQLGVGGRAAHCAGASALVCGDAFVSLHDAGLMRPPSSVAPSARHLPPEGEGVVLA